MPLTESQLNTWANQGATVSSAAAYSRIRGALSGLSSGGVLLNPSIYLQGSYGNTTNVYGNSDIDVVVEYDGSFHYDVTSLSVPERAAHAAATPNATYLWQHFRNDVYAALVAQFGTAVAVGPKAIKVNLGGAKPVDVLPVLTFRKYHSFISPDRHSATSGVQFFDAAGNAIVNYPKLHSANGEAKNQGPRTAGRYKPTVRVFKNMRSYLVANGRLPANVAPSYFLECALYNVPDALFVGSLSITVPAILAYLQSAPTPFTTQNEQEWLFGMLPTQWNVVHFNALIGALHALWRDGQ